MWEWEIGKTNKCGTNETCEVAVLWCGVGVLTILFLKKELFRVLVCER